jgi:ketosteroid isomerase-like protein
MTTAADIVRRHLDKVDGGMQADLADAYAVDAVVDLPFMPGDGGRLEGRDAIRRHFAAAEGLPIRLRIQNLTIHETADPEVVIAEYDYEGSLLTTKRSFTVRNIQVFRLQDGKIVESRDYHDHARIAAVLRDAAHEVEAG